MQKLPPQYWIVAAPLRLFFKVFYTRLAWTYDWVASVVSSGNWIDWVFSVIPHLHGVRILELGFGPGHLMTALIRNGFRVVGLDVSRQMCRRLVVKVKRNGMGGLVVNGYAQFMPLPNNSFDHVVATFPSDYIFDPKTLSEIWRVLVPGGSFIMLPIAWLSSPKWFELASVYLLKLSNFRFDWNSHFIDQLCQQGFIAKSELVHKDNSMVVLIIAHKATS
jgi:ubiquinone/menaquinone biosynthesis C-methylase UbiE